MKNYYEILQVNEKASKEIIEKVYKTLAKKYHPDANPEEKKKWAEEKFKEINEAYEILSDEEKRNKYDEEIKSKKASSENMYKKLYEENLYLKNQLERMNVYNTNSENINNYQNIEINVEERINNSVQKAYRDAYIKRMKDYGYKIRKKKTFKEWIKDIEAVLIAILIMIVIFRLLWFIPEFKEYMSQNILVQLIEKLINR